MKLEVQGVCFEFEPGVPVLEDVSFTVGPNEAVYLLGHNGSGKTTLMECMAGIRTPTAGRVLLDGVDIREFPPAERAQQVGLVPQIHIPVFAYSVRDMVLMGRAPHLGLLNAPRRTDYQIADQAVSTVRLGHLRDRPYTEISGGERQLTMIARGLTQQSRFLLLDEPDSHLDPKNQHVVLETIAGLARRNLAFVISSHIPNNALLYADRVILLKRGRVLAVGAPGEVLNEGLLSEAYEMGFEIVYGGNGNSRQSRAIIPRR
jgi:iron complex transport system ATP-binding protein